jgi:hypothetical protein
MDMTQIVSGGKEKRKMQGGVKKMKPEGGKLTPRLIYFVPFSSHFVRFFSHFPIQAFAAQLRQQGQQCPQHQLI